MIWEHSGPGEQGSEGRKQKRGLHKGSGPGRKEPLAAFPMGAMGVSYKDFAGLLCIKLGKLHISGYPISPSPFQISHPYPVPTFRGQNAVLCERSTDGNCQLVRGRKRGQTWHSCLGPPLPSTSSVQFSSHDFFLEKTSVPCKFECLL